MDTTIHLPLSLVQLQTPHVLLPLRPQHHPLQKPLSAPRAPVCVLCVRYSYMVLGIYGSKPTDPEGMWFLYRYTLSNKYTPSHLPWWSRFEYQIFSYHWLIERWSYVLHVGIQGSKLRQLCNTSPVTLHLSPVHVRNLIIQLWLIFLSIESN